MTDLIHEGGAAVHGGVFGEERGPGPPQGLVDEAVAVVMAGHAHAPLVQLQLLLQQHTHGLVQVHVVGLQGLLGWVPLAGTHAHTHTLILCLNPPISLQQTGFKYLRDEIGLCSRVHKHLLRHTARLSTPTRHMLSTGV